MEYEKFIETVCVNLSEKVPMTHRCETNKVMVGESGASHEIDVYWEFSHNSELHRVAIRAIIENVKSGSIIFLKNKCPIIYVYALVVIRSK